MYNSYLKNLDKRFKIIKYINILDNDILATIISMKLIVIHNADGINLILKSTNTSVKRSNLKARKEEFPFIIDN